MAFSSWDSFVRAALTFSSWDSFVRAALTFFIAFIPTWATWVYINRRRKEETLQLPPGPRGLPLLGNLPFVDCDLHRYITKLTRTYGPIIKLQLGSKTCVSVNSASTAKEVLKDHDTIFGERDPLIAALTLTNGGTDISWSPYGPHWRMLRKVCVQEMLTNVRLEDSYPIRRQEMRQTVSDVYAKAGTGTPVNVGDLMFLHSLNVMTSLLFGATLNGEEMASARVEFGKLVEEVTVAIARPNISDLFPLLARFDLQGVDRRAKRILLWLDRILDSIINQRLRMNLEDNNKGTKKDFLHHLLQVQRNGDPKTPLTMTHVKGLLMAMMVGGTSSTYTTPEWAMAELMQHPEIMRKAQEELEEVVGRDNVVEESHLPKLCYLDAIVKEVLRLHPVGPFLLPRCPSSPGVVGGYMVPKGAQVLVNIWAIHRDPECWENPLEFRPERFFNATDNQWNYNGNNFSYLPFGSGRRMCVGLPIVERVLMYMLASLLHSFEWRLLEGAKLDFLEKFNSTIKKANPLFAIPTPRLGHQKLYT